MRHKFGWLQQACLNILDAQGGVIEDWHSFHLRLSIVFWSGEDLKELGWHPPLKPWRDVVFDEVTERYRYADEIRYVPRRVPSLSTFNPAWYSLERIGLVKIEWSFPIGSCVDIKTPYAYNFPKRISANTKEVRAVKEAEAILAEKETSQWLKLT